MENRSIEGQNEGPDRLGTTVDQHELAEQPTGQAVLELSRLSPERQAALVGTLDPAAAADWLECMVEAQAADVMEELDATVAAAILLELSSNEQADLIQEIDHAEAEAILDSMEPGEADMVRALAAYPADTAGGLMITEYLAYSVAIGVDEVLADLRRKADYYADYQVQYIYVLAENGALAGVLRLRDLLMSRPSTVLEDLMIPSPVSVRDTASLEEIRQLFDAHDYFGIPVVAESEKLVGLIRRSDVSEALTDRAEGDYRKSQGIVGGEEIRSMPTASRIGRRLAWLSVNILLNVVAASVIAFYEDTLTAVIALAAFLPIISDMSGCSGNQAVAVSMRELVLGLVHPREILRTLRKEIFVGIFNGIALGTLLGFVAWLWRDDVFLSLVVGGALAVNTVMAVSIGGIIPLILRRFGLDPALASGPILTTITDMFGFFFALSFATAMLPYIAH